MQLRTAALAATLISNACTCVGAVADDGTPRPVSGTVVRALSLCDTLPRASVQMLDGPTGTTSDGDGHFSLDVTGRGALRVTGPGLVEGLTFVRKFERGSEHELAGAIPTEAFTLFHLLAGFEPNPELGSVVAIVVDAAPLPVLGAVVTLVDENGNEVATDRRRTVVLVDNAPAFETTAETGITGATMFFNVPVGTYRLRVDREGTHLADAVVYVRRGAASVDFVPVTAVAGTPVPFTGLLRGYPPFPASGPVAPLEGAQVTLTVDGAEVERVTSGSDGKYLVHLPKLGSWFDVTVDSDGRVPTRSRQLCAGTSTSFNFSLDGRFEFESEQNLVRRGRALVQDAGTIVVAVRQAGQPLAGATLTLDPPVVEPSYQHDMSVRPMCPRGTCAGGEPCPNGTRCEAGECLVGEVPGALCRACGTTPCATGYGNVEMPEPDGGFGCRCIPNFDSCTRANPSCEPGTSCVTFTAVDAGVRSIVGTACAVLGAPSPVTQTLQARGVPSYFTDVPPGTYVVRSRLDGGEVAAMRVRVSEGVLCSSTLP